MGVNPNCRWPTELCTCSGLSHMRSPAITPEPTCSNCGKPFINATDTCECASPQPRAAASSNPGYHCSKCQVWWYHVDHCPSCDPREPAPAPSILTEAASLISGDRRDAYGSYSNESKRIAAMWSVILNTTIKPEQVPICMIALKLVRESHQHKRDSLVDICGYAALLDQLYEK